MFTHYILYFNTVDYKATSFYFKRNTDGFLEKGDVFELKCVHISLTHLHPLCRSININIHLYNVYLLQH